MKKTHSKSTITKKNKTFGGLPESKKNSRIYRANSSIKINSQVTQQVSSNLNLHPNLSKSNLHNNSQKVAMATTHAKANQLQLIDRQQSHRTTTQHHIVKSSIETLPTRQTREEIFQLRQVNQELVKENTNLKKKCCELQESSLRDKQKIKNLIIRINQVKNQKQMGSQAKTLPPSTSKLMTGVDAGTASYSFLPHKQKLQTPYKKIVQAPCQRQDCLQRKKYLQSQLYRQRIQRDKLQMQRFEWQKNREVLKQQYNQLLGQIRQIRENQF